MGLFSGDTILSINNEPVDVWNIGSVLKTNIGKDIVVLLSRDEKKVIAETHCPVDNCIL